MHKKNFSVKDFDQTAKTAQTIPQKKVQRNTNLRHRTCHNPKPIGRVNNPLKWRCIGSLISPDLSAMVRFMKSLTDPRVQRDQAPFDHPALFV